VLSSYPKKPYGFHHSKTLRPERSETSELMCVAVTMIVGLKFTGVFLVADLYTC
jgi:hypothetical protein